MLAHVMGSEAACGREARPHVSVCSPQRVAPIHLFQRVGDLGVANAHVDADLERRRPGFHHVVQQRLSQGLHSPMQSRLGARVSSLNARRLNMWTSASQLALFVCITQGISCCNCCLMAPAPAQPAAYGIWRVARPGYHAISGVKSAPDEYQNGDSHKMH